MTDHADFMPRAAQLRVGAVELDAQEFTIAKRDAALKVLLAGLDVATLVKPFWEAAKGFRGKDGEPMVDLTVIAGKLKEVFLQVLGEDLTTVSCLTLDTPQNRKRVAVLLSDAEVEKVEQDKSYGYAYSPRFFAWARENLTVQQEYRLLEAVVEINDFAGLVKNYATLVTATLKAAREKAAPKK